MSAWVFSEWDALPQQKLLRVSETAVLLSRTPAAQPNLFLCIGIAGQLAFWMGQFGELHQVEIVPLVFLKIISWLNSLNNLTAGGMSSVSSGLGLEHETSFSSLKLSWSCILCFSTVLQNPSRISQE